VPRQRTTSNSSLFNTRGKVIRKHPLQLLFIYQKICIQEVKTIVQGLYRYVSHDYCYNQAPVVMVNGVSLRTLSGGLQEDL
jgi:hypothetical protein